MRVEQEPSLSNRFMPKKPFKILHNVKREKKLNSRKLSSTQSDKSQYIHRLQSMSSECRKFSLTLPLANSYKNISSPTIESQSFSNQQMSWPSINSQEKTMIQQEKVSRTSVDNLLDLVLPSLQLPNFNKMEEQSQSNKSSITPEFREFQEEDQLQYYVKGIPFPYSSRLINYDEFENDYQLQKNYDSLSNLF